MATCNVGANKPEEYGDYYAWGETEPKTDYSWSTYKWCNGSSSTLTKYGTVDNKTVLAPEDDVAHVMWGGDWRMPTKEEQDELLYSCTWKWYSSGNSEFGGVAGFKVTSNMSGYTDRFIFLPAAGGRYDTYLDGVGSGGDYWSSSLDAGSPGRVWYLRFYSYSHYTNNDYRDDGRSVRPVCPSSEEWLDKISIALDSNSKSILQKEKCTLTATVMHGNDILNHKVSWSSANSSIATVSETGVVTGKAVGSTTISATCHGKTATCEITVRKLNYNGHGYVDLGLSVNWATCNVGANKPEGYGDYYAWGETETKSTYDFSNYKWYGSSSTLTKYGTVDNKTVLDPEDDVAHVKWGGDWRMPTKAEQDELRNNCTWTWYSSGNSEFGGVAGYKVTSTKSGYTNRFIFLPAAGYRYDTYLYDVGSNGDYWSSSLNTVLPDYAWFLYFNSDYLGANSYSYRRFGRSVRPVCP